VADGAADGLTFAPAQGANVAGFSPQGSVNGGDMRQVAVSFDAPLRPRWAALRRTTGPGSAQP
jgi:hypothetical protein